MKHTLKKITNIFLLCILTFPLNGCIEDIETTNNSTASQLKETQEMDFESERIFREGHPRFLDPTSDAAEFWKDDLVFDAVVIKDKDNYDSEFNHAYIVLDCFKQSDSDINDSDIINGVKLYFDRCNDVPRVTLENAVDILSTYIPIDSIKDKYYLSETNYKNLWSDTWSFEKGNVPLQYDYYASYKLTDKNNEIYPNDFTVHLYTDSYGIVVEASILSEEYKTEISTDKLWGYDYFKPNNDWSKGEIASELFFDNELCINYPRPNDNTILRLGDKNAEVGWLQSALNKAMDLYLTVDCELGQSTETKLIEFQTRCGLSADGIAGKATIDELISILQGNRTMPPPILTTLAPRSTEPVQQATEPPQITEAPQQPAVSNAQDFVLNTNTKKYHYQSCGEINRMKEENKSYYHGSAQDLDNQGYTPCGKCHPR